jgi:hypothetical protein
MLGVGEGTFSGETPYSELMFQLRLGGKVSLRRENDRVLQIRKVCGLIGIKEPNFGKRSSICPM